MEMETIIHDGIKYIPVHNPDDACTRCAFFKLGDACRKYGSDGGCKNKIFTEDDSEIIEPDQFKDQFPDLEIHKSYQEPVQEVGRKFDSDKPMYDLIPPYSLLEIAKNLTYGAKKYDPENWRNVPNARRRYFSAAMRHMWAWFRGEKNDPENDIHHLAAACVNLMFLMEKDLENK